MSFIPTPDTLLVFSVASLLLIFTPGPDMTFFLGQTLSGGRTRGFAAMLGASAGLLVHSMLAAFGLSALLVASAEAFAILKIVGAVYLLWLAVQVIRRGAALNMVAGDATPQPLRRVFLLGAGVNLLNPKIIMFFLTFLPQFVSVADPQAGAKLLFLGLYFAALGLPSCALLILVADRFTGAVKRSPRFMRAFDWLFAGLMGTFAVRLLFVRNG
jgi:threonine/homoserine/homoserine lactone efflux protein